MCGRPLHIGCTPHRPVGESPGNPAQNGLRAVRKRPRRACAAKNSAAGYRFCGLPGQRKGPKRVEGPAKVEPSAAMDPSIRSVHARRSASVLVLSAPALKRFFEVTSRPCRACSALYGRDRWRSAGRFYDLGFSWSEGQDGRGGSRAAFLTARRATAPGSRGSSSNSSASTAALSFARFCVCVVPFNC